MVIPTLPEKIDRGVFAAAGLNGQLSTEASILVERATIIASNGRAVADNQQLRRAFLVLFHYWRSLHCPAHLLLPLVGVAEGLLERGALDFGFLCRWWFRVIRWYLISAGWPYRPGWNDYLMSCWFVTGSAWRLEEIYHRAVGRCVCCDLDLGLEPVVSATAVWMINSVRADYSDFHSEMCEVERLHGRAVDASLYAEALRRR